MKVGLKINMEKIKVMKIRKEDNEEMNVEIDGMEQTKQFKYLGGTIEEDGNEETQIYEQIQATTKLYYAINTTIPSVKNIVVYKSTLKHGSEICVLIIDKKYTISYGMRYLRKTQRVTRKQLQRLRHLKRMKRYIQVKYGKITERKKKTKAKNEVE